jgi:hypothetical protein
MSCLPRALRPLADEDAFFDAVDIWGQNISWHLATTGTSGVGVAYCHIVIFGIVPSGTPLYIFIAPEDAEALAPILRRFGRVEPAERFAVPRRSCRPAR